MVFRFDDSEVTPTYEEMCAIMGHHPVQDETPALPPGTRYDLAEIAALCPVYLPDGIDLNQGLPLEPFLSRVLSMDTNPSWVRACCFLLLNMYVMKNRQPGIGDFRLLTVVRDMQMYRRTVFMMIMGETMCWSLLTNLADRWRNRNTLVPGSGVMQDIVTPEYVNRFYTS
ncbi:hypothetical protein JCGZ_16696 [Jatropha curcas]|uniref:Aminotransferase-like plant mobile domain-containing protein n=1 Tax=Jatropha curcas TaxID=180498 RepID=A0A067K641_JATCU|nr:hypothetical protein JCGZ_16696 [Jatropha curcas]